MGSASPGTAGSARLGIVAGGGPLPGHVIAACRQSGRPFFVFALEGFADPAVIGEAPHAWVRLGAFGPAWEILCEQQIGELVMIGPVNRPPLRKMGLDAFTARKIASIGLAAMRNMGDDGLLRAVIRLAEEEGFRVIGVDEILDGLLAEEGTCGSIAPDADALADIARGMSVARAIGRLDVGQAVVVQEGIVLGVEVIEGTDALLERCAALGRDGPGGVLVKMRKPGQERRIDLPTIGATTVAGAARAGLRGIAVEAGGTLIVDREAAVAAADKAGLFVIGVVPAEGDGG